MSPEEKLAREMQTQFLRELESRLILSNAARWHVLRQVRDCWNEIVPIRLSEQAVVLSHVARHEGQLSLL